MFIKRIKNLNNALDSLGATAFARICADKKARIFIFKISELKLSAALILKQEALSAGGDFIVPKELILGENGLYSGVLIATALQLEKIIAKCAIQPFGLKKVGANLAEHLGESMRESKPSPSLADGDKGGGCNAQNISGANFTNIEITHPLAPSARDGESNVKSPQIMGIINITPDSFYAPSRTMQIDDILQKIEAMIAEGVAIIDIGAASSRPDSENIAPEIELARLKKPIEAIFSAGFTQKVAFSIDSYNYECAEFCAERGFTIINDVYGLRDMRLAELAQNNDKKIILMHNSWLFPPPKDSRGDTNIIQSVDEFFADRLESLDKIGIKKEQIILDIGFGFGKNDSENIVLIENLAHFRHFGCALLVGASMKRTIGAITGKETQNRLFGTLALHQIALDNGADIIRCHDFSAHSDMLKVWIALNRADSRGIQAQDSQDSRESKSDSHKIRESKAQDSHESKQ